MADEESVHDTELWGEMETNNSPSLSWNKDVLNNIEQDVIINSVKNISYKKIFCNQEELALPFKKENESIKIDDAIKQTVKLIKYKNDIKGIVENSKFQRGGSDIDEQLHLISSPSYLNKEKNNSNCLQFYRDSNSDFTKGICTEVGFNITNDSALNVLRSSISTVLAFVGFTETTILPLQIFTEVTENYIKTIVKLLHINTEKEKIFGESGFCDVLDRTLHETGFGSLRNLVSYYQNDVLAVKNKKLKECRVELNLYEDIIMKMKNEKEQLNELNSAEMQNENLIIPELHVTSIIGNDLLSESFETGLQMLHTLERQQLVNENVGNSSVNSEVMLSDLLNAKNELGEIKSFKRKRK